MVESTYAFNFHGPDHLKGLVALVSMLIYGIGYLPIILGISLECPLGYLAATLFSWIYTVEFFINAFCRQENAVSYILLFMSVLPEIVCFVILSVGLPLQLGISLQKRFKCRSKTTCNIPENEVCYKSMENSFQWTYVKNLLRKTHEPLTNKHFHQKGVEKLKSLMQCVLYVRSDDFRLSARMVSIITVGLIITYKITFIVMTKVYDMTRFFQENIICQFAEIGIDVQSTDTDAMIALRKLLFIAYKFVITFKECFLMTMVTCFVLNLIFLNQTLITYRNNLLSMYKGLSLKHLTSKEETSNPRLMCGSIRYAGYQVGHIGGGMFKC
ncbi:receptor for retinol uptake stra6 [Magallana gigas]|uniref:receptor for retinol uptake stra6 n=1 Tax=Magallana gigas TaxID=29159 RepID=UPI00334004BF